MSSKMLSRSSTRSNLSDPKPKTSQRRLPKLLQVLRCTGGRIFPDLKVTLPSNMSFRLNNYFKLLNAQKLSRERELEFGEVRLEEVKHVQTDWEVDTPQQPEAKRPKRSQMEPEGITWLAKDIVKAASLLQTHTENISFEDEEEMRRVFTLLYDVFRYKTILKEALDETLFSADHPQYKDKSALVWLLFYDLHRRRFLPRENEDDALCRKSFTKMGLISIEDDLKQRRVRLAAALARSRIKNRALQLNELLPKHLRDERLLSIDLSPATGWVNTFLISKAELSGELNKLGIEIQKTDDISTNCGARYDHSCPKVVSIAANLRADLARSSLVKTGRFILQDKAFCLAPTYMAKILKELSLRGTVAQSHVISPRSTAYLASVLIDNEKIEKVIAFGMGSRIEEYKTYLQGIGVTNCELFKERWTDVPHDSTLLENVVAVMASPPTSWTGVSDPVDLVCSRSGDMAMLRALTQSRRGRDILLLEEQRDTLRFAMSLPQVQVIIYESHSTSQEENSGMVGGAIECMNEWARQKHYEEHRLQQEQEEAEEKMKKSLIPGGTPAEREQREREALEAQEALVTPLQIEVPPCDLFEIAPLPDLCSHGRECYEEDGCFIARIQRKEIIGLDAKYMITMAEARGLFGSPTRKKQSMKSPKKKEELQRSQSSLDRSLRPKRHKIEMERISAHTHASLNRCCSSDIYPCERFQSHVKVCQKRRAEFRKMLIKCWWNETIDHVRMLLPYWRLTPRTRAVTLLPTLRLSRTLRRRPFPIHTVVIPEDRRSEPGDIDLVINSLGDIRRNSC